MTEKELVKRLMLGLYFMERECQASVELLSCIECCLQYKKEDRIKWDNLKLHGFFKLKRLTPVNSVIPNEGICLSLHARPILGLCQDLEDYNLE